MNETAGSDQTPDARWGPPANGLQCLLQPQQATYSDGEPFVFDLKLHNMGTNRLLVTDIYDVRPPPWIWSLRATGPDGMAVPYDGDMIVYCLTARPISGGAILNYTFTLEARNWDTVAPGEYRFQFSYERRPTTNEANVWSGTVTSQEARVVRLPNQEIHGTQ